MVCDLLQMSVSSSTLLCSSLSFFIFEKNNSTYIKLKGGVCWISDKGGKCGGDIGVGGREGEVTLNEFEP